MVAAVAIIGAVAGTVSTINVVKGWLVDIVELCQDFQESGNTVQDLAEKFNAFGSDLGLWLEFWGLEKEVSTRYLRELWQKNNDIESVTNKLTSIQAMAKRYEDVLLKYFTPPEEPWHSFNPFRKRKKNLSTSSATGGHQERPRPFLTSSQQRVTEYLETASKTRASLSARKILDFITLKCPILQGQLAELEKQLTVLKDLSLNLYNLRHPITLDGKSSKELDPAKTADLLRLVLESRMASSAVYRSCCALRQSILRTQLDRASTKPLYLELNLVQRDGMLEIISAPERQCLGLRFFFLVSWPAKIQMPFELFIEGPLSLESTNENLEATSGVNEDVLRQACEQALVGKQLGFSLPGISGDTQYTLGFRSRTPPAEESLMLSRKDGRQSREIILQPLATLLYNLDISYYAAPVEQFPLSERYRLAYKIVESGLMLCGTSWFSGLKIQHVHRSQKDIGRPRRYLLETDIGSSETSQHDPVTLQPHIFAVGRLLVEIATGHIILRVVPVKDRVEYSYEMAESLDESRRMPGVQRGGEEIFEEVSNNMGNDYCRAVEFCLRRFQSGTYWLKVRNSKTSEDEKDRAYCEILKQYYTQVYKPLKNLVEGCDLSGDGPNFMEGW